MYVTAHINTRYSLRYLTGYTRPICNYSKVIYWFSYRVYNIFHMADDNMNMGVPKAPRMDQNKLMAILAYIGPLVIVSYIVAKDNSFVKFHIKQALVLFVIEVAIWIIGNIFWQFWFILQIANLAVLVFVIIGIMNVVNGKETELPIIGTFSSYFPI